MKKSDELKKIVDELRRAGENLQQEERYEEAAKQAKEQGEDTCICPACQAGKEILANQAAIVS